MMDFFLLHASLLNLLFFFFSSRRRHTRWNCDWSSDVCSSDLGGLKDKSQPTRRMLVVHSRGMLMLGRKGLGRDREAQPVRVAISSTQAQARPNMKRVSLCGRACCRGTVEPRFPTTIHRQRRFVREAGKWPSCANLHSTFRLVEFRAILAGMGHMGMPKKKSVLKKEQSPVRGNEPHPPRRPIPVFFRFASLPVARDPAGLHCSSEIPLMARTAISDSRARLVGKHGQGLIPEILLDRHLIVLSVFRDCHLKRCA